MKNLKELKDKFISRCEQSKLKFECGMDGTMFADKVIIAEAPGEREVAQKLPLVGGSGQLLWSVLRKRADLSRKDFYITNVSKRQISFTDNKKAIHKNELSLWIELLLWELGHLPNIRYVLAMGNMALQALTGHTGITSWRGSVIDVELPDHVRGGTRTIKVVCINNAAAVVREPKLETVFNMDISTYKRVIAGTHKPLEVSTILYPTHEQLRSFTSELDKTEDIVGTDIEVIANETACVGFAASSTEALCVAFRDRDKNVYGVKEEIAIRKTIQEFYNSKTTRFVAQNGMFDITWLWYKDKIKIPKLWFDTMLGHHVLYPPLPHNLGFLTTQYTDNPYYKDEKQGWREGGDIDDFWRYNGKDCAHLLAISHRIHQELKSQGLDTFFFEHVMRLQPHLARMTVGGLKLDLEMKAGLKEELEAKVGDLIYAFQTLCLEVTGEDFYYNPASPKQMSQLYFSKLKLVGRGVSTDKENRDRMFKHPRTSEQARNIISLHNTWAEEHKFYSTYVKMGADDDGRIRCTYNQTGTQSAPGRLSSSQTLWGSGGNLQNQPDRAHPMFCADEGYGFGYFDLSQAEARYVGWDAQIERWIEQFERARLDGSYDAHRALASDMFHIPYDEVPSFDRYDIAKGHVIPEGKRHGDVTVRFVAKRCRHGLNYRMGPDKLATTTGLSLADADHAYRVYHRENPELRVWWNTLEQELKRDGALFNAYGRRYILMERASPEAMEAIVAFKPQSSIGDKVARVEYLAESHPRWPRRARMALNVHDALICLAPLEDLPMALSIMKAYAEEPMVIRGREMIIPADCKISYADDKGVHRWSQLKAISIENANISSSSTVRVTTTPASTKTTPILT